MRLMTSLDFLDQSFERERNESFSQNYRIANNVINQMHRDLQRLASTTASVEGMGAALQAQDSKKIDKSFEEYWFQLQLENDISTVGIFSPDGKKLSLMGDDIYPADIIESARETSAPSWAILCEDNCYMYAAIAMMVDGNDVGVALYGMPLSAFVVNYTEITSSQSGVILEKFNDTYPEYNPDIIAINNRDENTAVMQMAFKKSSISQLLNYPQKINIMDSSYEVSAMDIPGQLGKRRGYFIFINNITEKVIANNLVIKSSYHFEMVGFIIMEVCLFALLLGPLNRIRLATSYMPLLAKNAYSHVRESLSKKTRRIGVFDEADTLNRVAIELSDKLEFMQNELETRANALESHSLALRKERDFVTGVLDTAHALILTHDADGNIKLINHYGCWISGYEEPDLLGKPFENLFPDGQFTQEIKQNIKALSCGERNSYQHETDMQCIGGDRMHLAWYHSSLPVPDSSAYDILTVALDISERKKAEDHLGWLASHDALTSLFNRRRFTEELERVLALSLRYKHTGAVIFFDIDHFKEVNDTCGHHTGDILLKRIADSVSQLIRDTDTLARFGGDEFALLLNESSVDEATLVSQRICESIANLQISHQGNRLHVSASVGISVFPAQGDNVTDLMSNADMAMYCVKKTGRNGWSLFDTALSVKTESQERTYWSQTVKQSLHEDLIELFFQPICNISSGQITHYEALLRIRHEDSFLPPANFIRAAEESGLIKKVDEIVIQKAFAYQHHLQRNGKIVTLAINLSGQSFQNKDLFEHIRVFANAYSIRPERIIFEITETSAVSDIDITCKTMLTLKQDGYKFALDDFGSGFSSLYYLKQFPIDFIKIDGAFIKNIARDMEDRVLVKAVVDAAKAFNLKTIAEFAETEEIVNILKEIGVDYAQGYHIDKPKAFHDVWPALPEQISAAAG